MHHEAQLVDSAAVSQLPWYVAAHTAAATCTAAAAAAARQPSPRRSSAAASGLMESVSPPAAGVSGPNSPAPGQTPRPSSSGGSVNRSPSASDGGSGGGKSPRQPSGAAPHSQGRVGSGRGPPAPVNGPGAGSAAASPRSKRRSSQGSAASTTTTTTITPSTATAAPSTPSAARRMSLGHTADGTGAALVGAVAAGLPGTPHRTPPEQVSRTSDQAVRPLRPGETAAAAVVSGDMAPGGGGGGGGAASRRGRPSTSQQALSRASSDAGRSELALPVKPPLPSAPASASAAVLPDTSSGSRPDVKRSSSSSSVIAGAAAEVRVGRKSIDGGGGGIVLSTAPAAGAEGRGEQRVPSGRVSKSCGGAAAAPVASAPGASPRGTSGGAAGELPAAHSLLMPFRGGSGSQHPPSPGRASHHQQQQQQHSQQLKHPLLPPSPQKVKPQQQQQQQQQPPQQQRPPSPQTAHLPAANRCARPPTREGSSSNVTTGSTRPLGPGAALAMVGGLGGPPQRAYRRVSDSSSHVSYSPGGGLEGGCLTTAPPPMPPGLLLLHRRPSDDAMAAAGARRERPARPGSGDPTSPNGSSLIWVLPAATPGSSRPSSASGGVRDPRPPPADGAMAAARGGGGAPGKPVPAAGKRSAAESAPSTAGSGGILRSVELSPLSLPGGLDGGLRDALARQAVASAAELGAGALPAEPDFGYARVVEQHRRQQQQQQRQEQRPDQRQEQHQQQQHQHQHQQLQHRIEHPQQQPSPSQPPPPPPPQSQLGPQQLSAVVSAGGRSSRHPSLCSPSEAGSDAASVTRLSAGEGGPASLPGSAPVVPSPPYSPAAAPGPSARVAPGGTRPPRGARSTRGALKGGSSSAVPAESAVAAAAAAQHQQQPATTHGSPANLATASYRFLGLRRPSSKTSLADSDGENCPSATTAATAGGGRISGWMGAFAGGGGGGSLGPAIAADSELDPDPMGFRTAENVEIRIHCLTFNMGGIVPAPTALPESLFSGSYLSPDAAADAAHLYVFSTQESGPLADWDAAVAAHLGRRYTRVAAESLMSIHILLFAVRSMAPYIADIQTSSVATGVGNVLGNKGGVAVTFSLLGARVLLVGAHFAAHDQNVERRNADFHRICAGLFAPPSTDGAAAAAAAAGGGGSAAMPRSSHVTPEPERARGGPGSDNGGLTGALSDASAGAGGAGGGGAGARNGVARRAPLGPTLSRFSRGGVTFGGVDGDGASACGGGAVVERGEGSATSQGGGPGVRSLTRALSSSSVCSVASNVSAFPGSHGADHPLRARLPSFWGGVSFASAQRHSSALLSHFDVVIWMGDLNYRIAGTPEVLKFAIDKNMMEVLRANDQLQKQQKKGKVLQGFSEMPIAFAPTFKLLRGTDDYDMRRSPSWTDRVLYLVNADPLFADLRPLYYMSIPELRTSDHKPVIAGFELSISPQHAGDNRHARQRACVIS